MREPDCQFHWDARCVLREAHNFVDCVCHSQILRFRVILPLMTLQSIYKYTNMYTADSQSLYGPLHTVAGNAAKRPLPFMSKADANTTAASTKQHFHCCNTGYNNTGRQCTVLVRELTFYYFQTVVDILLKLCFSVVYKLSALTIQQQPCWERSASRRSSVLWLDGAGVLSLLIGWWGSGRTYVATLCDCLWFYFEIGNLKV